MQFFSHWDLKHTPWAHVPFIFLSTSLCRVDTSCNESSLWGNCPGLNLVYKYWYYLAIRQFFSNGIFLFFDIFFSFCVAFLIIPVDLLITMSQFQSSETNKIILECYATLVMNAGQYQQRWRRVLRQRKWRSTEYHGYKTCVMLIF